MVGHQTVSVENGSVAFPCGLQVREKSLSIRTPFEDSFPLIAPRGNVIPSSRVLDAQRSSHFDKFTSIFPSRIIFFRICQLLRPDTFPPLQVSEKCISDKSFLAIPTGDSGLILQWPGHRLSRLLQNPRSKLWGMYSQAGSIKRLSAERMALRCGQRPCIKRAPQCSWFNLRTLLTILAIPKGRANEIIQGQKI